VPQHDGTMLRLRKLHEGYDPTDRELVGHAQQRGGSVGARGVGRNTSGQKGCPGPGPTSRGRPGSGCRTRWRRPRSAATARRRCRQPASSSISRAIAPPRPPIASASPSQAPRAMARKISRCSTHHGQGCMPSPCWVTRAMPTASTGSHGGAEPGANAARSFISDFGDQFDLHAGAHRDLRHAKGAARMRADLGPNTSTSSSLQPLVTRWCSVKPACC
jgi:hypothetical protein